MRIAAALICAVALSTLFGVANARDGLRAGDPVAFEPGEPYSADKVPLRAAAKKLTDFLARYGQAPSPKALAVSQDSLQAFGFWERADRTPRTAEDVRRMALQHCEFHSGVPCRLVAVDGFLAKGEPTAVEALPKRGQFEPRRMPFWSTASIEGAAGIAKYVAEEKPKALAIAPADGAKWAWATGDSAAAARHNALAACLKRVEKPDLRCVVFVEGDAFVYGAPTADRQAVTGAPAAAAKDVMVLYVGAHNCPPCAFWESASKPTFLASPAAKKLTFREVKAGTYMDTRGSGSWPDDLKWIRDAGRADAGTPRFIVVVDGKIVKNRTGNWSGEVLPFVEKLVERLPAKG